MKVAISTLGCRVNIYDTEIMITALKKDGFEIVSDSEFADIYCINTCTVTNNSDKKSRQYISKCKKINSDSIIAMVGCYPQASIDEVSKIEGVNIILGNRFKSKLPYYINLFLDKGEKVIKIHENILKNFEFEDSSIINLQERHRAFIKIQDGCNKFCTYCIIPYARGGICSKEPRKVLEEVQTFVKNGYKEIVLAGINITSYGNDLGKDISFIDLIEMINSVDGVKRIRVGSVDPEFFNVDVIKRLRNSEKLMPHFHLSLQSGCDETLKRMRRRYNTSKFREVVNIFREFFEDVSITTDVIVGFPGETDEEFSQTVSFLEEIKLQDIHAFKYSKRNGTKAAVMDSQIDNSVKSERNKIIIDLNKKNKIEFMKRYLNKEVEVLYCTLSSDGEGVYGYTENYIKVYLNDKNYLGEIVNTYIVDSNDDFLVGEIRN